MAQSSSKSKNQINKQIGFRLKIAREAQMITQHAIAKRLGVGQARYSMYESGVRTLDHEVAAKFVKIVKIDFNFLYTGKMTSIDDEALRSRLRKAKAMFG